MEVSDSLYQVFHFNNDKLEILVKYVPVEETGWSWYLGKFDHCKLEKWVKFLEFLNHPNVIKNCGMMVGEKSGWMLEYNDSRQKANLYFYSEDAGSSYQVSIHRRDIIDIVKSIIAILQHYQALLNK